MPTPTPEKRSPIRAKLALHEVFKTVLTRAQAERSKRPDMVEDPANPGWREFAWIQFERNTMFQTVNEHRSSAGLPPVTLKQIRHVESQASGHSDYSSKFALYCTELALGEDHPQP